MPPKKKSKKDEKKLKKDKKEPKKTKDKKEPEKLKEETQPDIINEMESEKNSDEELSSEELNFNSESELSECDLDDTIEDDNEFFDNDESSEIQTDVEVKYITGKNRVTNPRLTRYEMVRILGERIKQLTMGAKPLVKNVQEITYDQIALEELKHNMIPFKIKRPLPNNQVEIWELKELDKRHLESLLN